MSLLDRIRKTVRVTASMVSDLGGRNPGDDEYVPTFSSPFDEELSMLIGAAERDMLRVGIREELIHPKEGDISADIEQCITLYVKCHFGYDNNEATRFGESYRMAVCDLMNSQANYAAYEEPVDVPNGDGSDENPVDPVDPDNPTNPDSPTE